MTDVLDEAGDRTADLTAAHLEPYRRELTGYCYRMLGSAFEADDAVQDTMVRAWKALDRFEGRSSLRSWLYRIATNVCLDLSAARQRRARPMDLGPAGSAEEPHLGTLPESTWVTPIPDGRVLPEVADPAELAVARDSVRLAFVAALQHLPARQRAVLVLREVLGWPAADVAALLETSVASVNSALQRARATMAARDPDAGTAPAPLGEADRALLDRYVDAFQRYDMTTLTDLIKSDATQAMPPYELWLSGREQILTFWQGAGAECRGSLLVPTTANGMPAFAQYRPSGPGGAYQPWALQLLDVRDGQIVDFMFFLDTDRVFPLFGIPTTPEPASAPSAATSTPPAGR